MRGRHTGADNDSTAQYTCDYSGTYVCVCVWRERLLPVEKKLSVCTKQENNKNERLLCVCDGDGAYFLRRQRGCECSGDRGLLHVSCAQPHAGLCSAECLIALSHVFLQPLFDGCGLDEGKIKIVFDFIFIYIQACMSVLHRCECAADVSHPTRRMCCSQCWLDLCGATTREGVSSYAKNIISQQCVSAVLILIRALWMCKGGETHYDSAVFVLL